MRGMLQHKVLKLAHIPEGHIDLLSNNSIKIRDFDSVSNRWQGFKNKDRLDHLKMPEKH